MSSPSPELIDWMSKLAKGHLLEPMPACAAQELPAEVALHLSHMVALWSAERESTVDETKLRLQEMTRFIHRERKIIELLVDGVVIVDKLGEIMRCNQVAAGLLHISTDSCRGYPLANSLNSAAEELLAFLEKSQNGNIVSSTQFHAQGAGELPQVPVTLSAGCIDSDDYHQRTYVIVIHDRREEFATRNQELLMIGHHKLATLGEMAVGVAHEVNQPLTFISGVIEMAGDAMSKGTFDGDQYANHFLECRRQIERITDIIVHLRTFGQDGGGKTSLIFLPDVFLNSMRLMKNRFAQDSIELHISATEDLPEILGNPTAMEQVFINLVQNSYVALIECSGERRLTVHFRRSDPDNEEPPNNIVITVEDNAGGMPAHVCERVFEPFFTMRGVGAGTGLGLSIVYGIVSKYGGTISCSSTPGEGTVFTLQLPFIP